jgi:adenylate cyclase
LSNTLLRSTQERIAMQVSAYLEPASHAILLAHTTLGRGGATDRAEEAYVFAASVLEDTPQIANVLFADAAGNFMLVTRAADGPHGATETKRILMQPSGRTVEWITRDSAGNVTARRQDPRDDFDARTRPWFTGARTADNVFWSGVYIFFSARAPGVTAAVHGPDANPDVVGVDIRLDELSRFLGGLSIGQTGRAYIVAKNGEMIAGPDPTRILQNRDGQLAPANIEGIGDPDLIATWDHFRAQGPGNRVIEVGDRRLISIVTPLANGQDWLLLITVPEAEFSGFMSANSRRAAFLSLIVMALAVGLAALLVRQGLRADRAARAVAERSSAVQQQSAAFARLASEAGMFDAAGTPPKALTETLAEATGARRAGVWRLAGHGQILRCDDSFEPATGGHVAGLQLSRQEAPALFEAMTEGEEVDAPDAGRDRRTMALHGSLMAPLGTTGVFAVPIRQSERSIGLVMLEDSRLDPAARDFARACATLAGLATPPELSASPVAPATFAVSRSEPQADELGLDPALTAHDTAGDLLPQAVVLVLTLRSAAAAALTNQIVCAVQEIAAAHSIPYVKMLGTTIVAAAGYVTEQSAGVADAALRLADVAIALRERCAALFDADDGQGAFGLGLDVGSFVGASLGDPPELFNLWGEVIHGAEALAASAPAEAIQTSERAYLLLRQGFLFRPRGLFYRPHTGEARSFVLAGRA